ncbi:hypothetical protein BH24ACT10_BH24ACT10_10240 [soil metagenome]
MLTRTVAPGLLALALLLAGCGSDEPDVQSAPSPTSPASSAPASPAPTGAPTAEPSVEPSSSSSARAVYWLGAAAEPRGPRLYREFAQRPDVDDPVRDAVELMLSGQPADPDYTSL